MTRKATAPPTSRRAASRISAPWPLAANPLAMSVPASPTTLAAVSHPNSSPSVGPMSQLSSVVARAAGTPRTNLEIGDPGQDEPGKDDHLGQEELTAGVRVAPCAIGKKCANRPPANRAKDRVLPLCGKRLVQRVDPAKDEDRPPDGEGVRGGEDRRAVFLGDGANSGSDSVRRVDLEDRREYICELARDIDHSWLIQGVPHTPSCITHLGDQASTKQGSQSTALVSR